MCRANGHLSKEEAYQFSDALVDASRSQAAKAVQDYQVSSDPYLYLGTTVLRDHRGLRDKEKLSNFEQQETALAIRDLRKAPVSGDFDYVHLREIHPRIFQDVYPFAGETRQMDMIKNKHVLAGASVAFSYTDDITRDAALQGESNEWTGLACGTWTNPRKWKPCQGYRRAVAYSLFIPLERATPERRWCS